MSVTTVIPQACESVQVHLSKPGGQRQGPFTVQQINRDLAGRKYTENDFWAWYEGLDAWIPLHAVPGVKAIGPGQTELIPQPDQTEPFEVQQSSPITTEEAAAEVVASGFDDSVGFGEPEQFPISEHDSGELDAATVVPSREDTAETGGIEPQVVAEPFGSTTGTEGQESESESAASSPFENTSEQTVATEPSEPATEMIGANTQSKIYSGMPADALDHIFVFTNGEGPSLRESGIATMMLLEMIGEDPDSLRQRVVRDVFGKSNTGERIRSEGKIPGSAWRAMSALRPELVQAARAGAYHTCVRTFSTETEDVVAIFLFYNKARLA